MKRAPGPWTRVLPLYPERARVVAQIVLVAVAMAAAAGAGYRYVSTRGTTSPLRAPVPAVRATPVSGPVGLRPFLDVDGWPKGTLVKVELCASSPPVGCVELGSGRSPGRIRSVAVPATLPAAGGTRPVDPGAYQLRATAAGGRPVTGSFQVVPFAIGARPEPRPYEGVDLRTLELGRATEVARGGACSARFLPDDRLLLGKSIFDPRTAVSLDLSIGGAELAWSPGGERLAIVTDDRKEIRIAQPDGTGQEVVVREARGIISSVSWSPEGDKIAFVVRPQPGVRGGPSRPTASIRDLLTDQRSDVGPAEAVAWSPVRADRLAIEVAEGGGRAIHVVDPGGKGSRLTDGRAPAWSPDGTLLAFVRGGETGAAVVAMADAPAVATLADGDVCGIGFSSDGTRVVLVRRGETTQVELRAVVVESGR